jgi:hypothetical protein
MASLDDFRVWLEELSQEESFFSGTFWFLFSKLGEQAFYEALDLGVVSASPIPSVRRTATSTVYLRTGKSVRAAFSELPIHRENVRVLFSLEKATDALRPMYRLLARTRGKVHLFPLGAPLMQACARLVSGPSLGEAHVLRGVSYPTRPSYGGADINLRPGTASVFFAKLREERRVLKTVRLKAPTGKGSFCEFTIGRPGYITYHRGLSAPLLDLITGDLMRKLSSSVRPFEETGGRFVGFRF